MINGGYDDHSSDVPEGTPHDDDGVHKGENWMSAFWEYELGQLPVIPGTHNSGTHKFISHRRFSRVNYPIYRFAKTQSLSIRQQLDIGIRCLDLRLHMKENKVWDREEGKYVVTDGKVRISHSFDTSYTLDEVMQEVKDFLYEHPSESVLLYIRIDWEFRLPIPQTDNQDNPEWQKRHSGLRRLHCELNRYRDMFYCCGDQQMPLSRVRVDSLAKKAVLIMPREYFPFNDLNIPFFPSEDTLSVNDVWEITDYRKVRERINAFMTQNTPSSERDILKVIAIDPPALGRDPWVNQWFFQQFSGNSVWLTTRMNQPIGILLIDYVTKERAMMILEYGQLYLKNVENGKA